MNGQHLSALINVHSIFQASDYPTGYFYRTVTYGLHTAYILSTYGLHTVYIQRHIAL